MEWNHDYTVSLCIGYPVANRLDVLNPSTLIDLEDWETMSQEEQEEFMNEAVREWAANYIHYDWTA